MSHGHCSWVSFENLSRSKGFESYKFIESIPRFLGYYMLVELIPRPLGILHESYMFVELIPRFLGILHESYMLVELIPRFLGILHESYKFIESIPRFLEYYMLVESIPRSLGSYMLVESISRFLGSYMLVESVPRPLGSYMLVESVSRPLGILQESYKFIESIPRFLGSYMLVESIPRPLGILQCAECFQAGNVDKNILRFYGFHGYILIPKSTYQNWWIYGFRIPPKSAMAVKIKKSDSELTMTEGTTGSYATMSQGEDKSIVIHFHIPMPSPGTANAPWFDSRDATLFTERFEDLERLQRR
uniref:Uncharacterized protein n=1 Tax=Coccidioides posadasii RMSCC 3488 TaxID=454284 RepID=A0A0J6FQ97_COCPO|nr:hypothetical protein CPAG_07466 [Coccidioides posadasii RMSCC 3488]